ncbi:MAG: molybdopterin-dependent oxidoreductase [Allorhizobium sp.]
MKSIIAALLASALTATAALALDTPTGPVVLTVKGAISNTNAGDTAQFDLAMLEKLKGRKGEMETPWTEGKVTFEGPLLREVLAAAGATGANLKVRALNDYAADVPADDAKLDTILATKLNGKAMSIRDKGPLMLVYPFDLDAGLYNEKYFSRSVWQIKEIEVGQ